MVQIEHPQNCIQQTVILLLQTFVFSQNFYSLAGKNIKKKNTCVYWSSETTLTILITIDLLAYVLKMAYTRKAWLTNTLPPPS